MQKNKTGEAMRMLNNIHMRFTGALASGQSPDFTLIDQLKEFCEASDQVTEIEHCANCKTVLVIEKSLYAKLFINQLNICSGNKEETIPRLTNNEVYLCNDCGTNLVKYIKFPEKEKNL